jgi:hypothetical protein
VANKHKGHVFGNTIVYIYTVYCVYSICFLIDGKMSIFLSSNTLGLIGDNADFYSYISEISEINLKFLALQNNL